MEFKANIWKFSDQPENDWLNSGMSSLNIVDTPESLASITFPRKNQAILLLVTICGSVKIDFDMRSVLMPPKSLMVLLPGHYIEGYEVSADFKGFMMTASVGNFTSALPLLSRLLICSLHFKDNSLIRLTDAELVNQVLFRDLLRRKMENSSGVYDSLVVNKLCEGIFYETMNIYFNRIDERVSPQCKRSELLFYRFIVSIENNFKTRRSVSFYADALCVTSKYLSSVVKEISGRTAGDWIDSYVISEIKRLLATTDLTVQEISCKMQFANQSFFGKYFKKHTGMSPREYRNRVLPDSEQ